VNSSGPREELTAADLAAARGSGQASPGNDGEDAEEDAVDTSGQQGLDLSPAAAAAAAGMQAEEPVAVSVSPAAASAEDEHAGRSSSSAGLVKGLLQRFSSKGKAQQVEQADATEGSAAGETLTLIPAFRPEEVAAPAQPPALQQQAAAVRHDGAISREAAQQLKALVAALSEKPAEQLAADHAEALIDWETPFKLEVEEDAQFGELLPFEMPGRPGLLMAAKHDPHVGAARAATTSHVARVTMHAARYHVSLVGMPYVQHGTLKIGCNGSTDSQDIQFLLSVTLLHSLLHLMLLPGACCAPGAPAGSHQQAAGCPGSVIWHPPWQDGPQQPGAGGGYADAEVSPTHSRKVAETTAAACCCRGAELHCPPTSRCGRL
jgi:hypothetical protein